MSIITITGANGHLGRLVIEHLLAQGLPASRLRASVRDTSKAADLSARGIDVRQADFDDLASLQKAFAGSQAVLIISTDKLGSRIAQHGNAVRAAKEAGLSHLAYTSMVKAVIDPATGAEAPLAVEHRATEQAIFESGLPYTILRNSFYSDYQLLPILKALPDGVFRSSVGSVPLGCASRSNYAEAAADVLLHAGHENKVYELTAPVAWTQAEAVEIVQRVSGKPFRFEPVADVPGAEGPNPFLRAGMLSLVSPDLEQILGHPVTSLEEQISTMLKAS